MFGFKKHFKNLLIRHNIISTEFLDILSKDPFNFEVLTFLVSRLKHGMIIAFNDSFMFTKDSISGNRNAMLEIFDENLPFQLIPYMQYSHVGFSFIVEDKKLLQ